MNEPLKSILYASSLLLVLAACLLTGHSQSPVRFLFFPLIVLLAGRITLNYLLKSGLTFSILFVLMVFLDDPPNRGVYDLTAEALSFFLVTMAAGYIVRDLAGERQRAENAVATFHGLSEDLESRTSNLQATLDALSQANRQLQQADQKKSTFLANVSHELRTPLTSIRSYSEILLNYNDLDDDTRKDFIRTINAESERMSLLVNENLDLLRIEMGKQEMHICQIRPAVLIEESVKVVAPMARGKDLPLHLDIPADMPLVKGDETQLNQVLVNLLNNAVKFTAQGSITVGVRRLEDCAEFFVTDTGEGIFPEEKEVIFDEFYRISEQMPERPRGSGLGLCIARKIVEHHDGRIWVESIPGKGSTFFFTVPVAGEEHLSISPEVLPEIAEISRQYGPILVIYESIAVRQSLRKKLENLGYKTVGADSPKIGLELAAAIKPGLIITEIVGSDEAFERLGAWAHGAGIEIKLATFSLNPTDGELCLAVNGYLTVPFDRFQIVSVIESFVKKKGQISIVSPVKDEARNLQVLLGAEGYGASLFMDEIEAIRGGGKFPNGVIVGSFPRSRREAMFQLFMADDRFSRIPCFLMLGENSLRHVTPVTLSTSFWQSRGEGIYSLIQAIEKTYTKRWETAMSTGGYWYGNGLPGR
jgi:signal transduction histidine kinase/CheY-like chemotaxis protein